MPPKVFCWWDSKAWSGRAKRRCDHNSSWWLSVTLTQQRQAKTGSAVTSARPGSQTTLLRLWLGALMWPWHIPAHQCQSDLANTGNKGEEATAAQQGLSAYLFCRGCRWALCSQARTELVPWLCCCDPNDSEEEKEEAETPSNEQAWQDSTWSFSLLGDGWWLRQFCWPWLGQSLKKEAKLQLQPKDKNLAVRVEIELLKQRHLQHHPEMNVKNRSGCSQAVAIFLHT